MDLPEWLISDNLVTAGLSGLVYGWWRSDFAGQGLTAAIIYAAVGGLSSYFHLTQLYRGNVVNGAKA